MSQGKSDSENRTICSIAVKVVGGIQRAISYMDE